MWRFAFAMGVAIALSILPPSIQGADSPVAGASMLEAATRDLMDAKAKLNTAQENHKQVLKAARAVKEGDAKQSESALKEVNEASIEVETAESRHSEAVAKLKEEHAAAVQSSQAEVNAGAKPPVREIDAIVAEKLNQLRTARLDPDPPSTCLVLVEVFQSLRKDVPSQGTVSHGTLLELRMKANSTLAPKAAAASPAVINEWKPFLSEVFNSIQTPTKDYNPTDAEQVGAHYDKVIAGLTALGDSKNVGKPTSIRDLLRRSPSNQTPSATAPGLANPGASPAGSPAAVNADANSAAGTPAAGDTIAAKLKALFDAQSAKLKDPAMHLDQEPSVTCADLAAALQQVASSIDKTGAIAPADLSAIQATTRAALKKVVEGDGDGGKITQWSKFTSDLAATFETSVGAYNPLVSEQLHTAYEQAIDSFNTLRKVAEGVQDLDATAQPNGGGANANARAGGGGGHAGTSWAAVHHARVMNGIERRQQRRSYAIQRIYAR